MRWLCASVEGRRVGREHTVCTVTMLVGPPRDGGLAGYFGRDLLFAACFCSVLLVDRLLVYLTRLYVPHSGFEREWTQIFQTRSFYQAGHRQRNT